LKQEFRKNFLYAQICARTRVRRAVFFFFRATMDSVAALQAQRSTTVAVENWKQRRRILLISSSSGEKEPWPKLLLMY
jgi:hypothetical protein